MGWAYPREKLQISYVLDADVFNANLAAFAAETDGNINEHNLVDDFGLRAAGEGKLAESYAISLFSRQQPMDPFTAQALQIELRNTVSWTDVNGTLKTFTSGGGMVLVIISFQLDCDGHHPMQCGLNFCIELDGAPMFDSLIGTGDPSNELLSDTVGITVGSGEIDLDWGSSPSIRASKMPLQVKGVYRLSPGLHQVRLVSRNLMQQNFEFKQFVSQREVIVLNGWC